MIYVLFLCLDSLAQRQRVFREFKTVMQTWDAHEVLHNFPEFSQLLISLILRWGWVNTEKVQTLLLENNSHANLKHHTCVYITSLIWTHLLTNESVRSISTAQSKCFWVVDKLAIVIGSRDHLDAILFVPAITVKTDHPFSSLSNAMSTQCSRHSCRINHVQLGFTWCIF